MKSLIATLSPAEAEAVCKALYAAGLIDIVMTDVRAYRPGARPDEIYKGARYAVTSASYVKLEVRTDEAAVDLALALIFDAAAIDQIDIVTLEPMSRVRPERTPASRAVPQGSGARPALRAVMSPMR